MNQEFHVSSLVVLTQPPFRHQLAQQIAILEGAEVHAVSDEGKLVVTLERRSQGLNINMGHTYAYLDLTGSLPDDVLVQLKVGSGDVELQGVQGAVSIESIGSGDVDVRDSRGAVRLGSLGSGDLDVRGAASLKVDRLGSGSVNHSGISGSIDLPKKS